MLVTHLPSPKTIERSARRTKADQLILIADDERELRELLADFIELEGYAVVEARDGVEALELTHRLRPDLVLLDESMPKLGGHDVALELRRNATTEQVKIVMITGYSPVPGDRSQCDAYFQKPCRIESVVETIGHLLTPPR